MKKKSIPFLFFLSIFCISVEAQSTAKPPQKTHFSKLQKAYKDIKAISADFLQESYQSSLGIKKSSTGRLLIQKPQKIRWETHKPNANILVSDGYQVWYYDPKAGVQKKGQAILQPNSSIIEHPLFTVLNGSSSLSKSFNLKDSKKKAKSFYLALEPKDKGGNLQTLEIETDRSYMIQMLTLHYQNGNKTKIILQNVQLNPKLRLGLFHFKPPSGVEVIKE